MVKIVCCNSKVDHQCVIELSTAYVRQKHSSCLTWTFIHGLSLDLDMSFTIQLVADCMCVMVLDVPLSYSIPGREKRAWAENLITHLAVRFP